MPSRSSGILIIARKNDAREAILPRPLGSNTVDGAGVAGFSRDALHSLVDRAEIGVGIR